MIDDFFEDESYNVEKDFSTSLANFEAALSENKLYELQMSELQLLDIIEFYIDNNSIEKAYIAAETAKKLYPSNIEILFRYIELMIADDKSTEAINILEENKDILNCINEVHFLYAKAYMASRNCKQAESHISMFKSFNFSNESLYDIYTSLASICIDIDNYEGALVYFFKAEEYGTLENDFYSEIAFCYNNLDDFDNAIEYYKKFLEGNPFDDMIWFNLGTLYAEQCCFEKAIESFEYSLALNNFNVYALRNLAVSYMSSHNYTKALDTFKKYIELDKDNIDGYLGVADSLFYMCKFESSEYYYKKVKSIMPDNHEADIALHCIEIISAYKNGDREHLISRLNSIAKEDKHRAMIIYKAIPELCIMKNT